MFTHRQAAWRTAWTVGAALFPLLLLQLYMLLDRTSDSWVLPIPVAAAICATLAPVYALAFGLGYRLSGRKRISLKTVVITTVIYVALCLAVTYILSTPVQTHALVMDMPSTPEQTRNAFLVNVVRPVAGAIFVFFVLPALVAFGVARTKRAGVD